MKGAGIHVYFDKECIQIMERMEKGELSKICKKAVMSWDISSEDRLILEEQEQTLVEEKNKIDIKIAAIDKKLDMIAEREQKEFKEKIEFKKDLETHKERIKGEFMKKTKDFHKPENWLEQVFTRYWDERLKGEKPNMESFAGKIAFKEQQEGET